MIKALISLLVGLACFNVSGQSVDSLQTSITLQRDSIQHSTAVDNYDDYEDIPFKAGFIVIIMIGTAFLAGCVAAGAFLTVGLLVALFGLVSLGIVSASLLIGLYQKSVEKGFRSFVVLICSTGGMTVGAMAFVVLNQLMHWVSLQTALLTGAGCGLGAGILLGYVNFILLKRLTRYFKNRLLAEWQ